MSEIRVTYSGLISFIVGIGSIITGLIFTIIITRSLSPEEFGTWGLVGGLLSYVFFMGTITNFWSTREIARGADSGKTALISTFFISGLAIIFYFSSTFIFGNNIVDHNILIFAIIMIPIEFIRHQLISINYGFKPQNVEFGILAFEISKIVIVIPMIIIFDLGVIGAIIATASASMISVIILAILGKSKLKVHFSTPYIKKWFKLSWLSLYPKIGNLVGHFDIALFTIMTGSVMGLAYWGVTMSISRIIGHSKKVNKAIYPKLLGGGKKEYFQENFLRVIYFALPSTAMALLFSKPGLFILNPLYEIAVPIMFAMAPLFLLRVFTGIFLQSLSGIEKVDTFENSTFKDFLKSNLFYLPTFTLIQKTFYITSLAVMLYFLVGKGSSDIDLVFYWALIALILEISYAIFLYSLIKKEFKPKFNITRILKYVISVILAFLPTYFLMDLYLVYDIEVFNFLINLLPFLAYSIGMYLGITYLIDKKTKQLFHSIFSELQGIISRSSGGSK